MLALTDSALARLCIGATAIAPHERDRWLKNIAAKLERAPAPRSGYALDCRRQSGAEERGFAESDGALRDAMARGAQELRCSCRPVWPVDRPCARPKATPWRRARHGFKREPDPRRAGDE